MRSERAVRVRALAGDNLKCLIAFLKQPQVFVFRMCSGKLFHAVRGCHVKKAVTECCLDCKTVVFGRFRKARRAVSVILECEAREPHTPAGFHLSILPRRFYTRSRPFVRIWTVARVRKKYDCFAV